MQVHRTFEERLYIVRQILSGKALRPLSREYHVGRENARQWVLRYQTYGEEGLRLSHPGHYSSEEKIAIVKEFLEKGLSLQKVCLRHCISSSTLRSWISKVEKGQSLEDKRRSKSLKDPMARPKKKEPQTELEKLQAENLRLRAENALLKKVKALVEEQKARERLSGQKPSTN